MEIAILYKRWVWWQLQSAIALTVSMMTTAIGNYINGKYDDNCNAITIYFRFNGWGISSAIWAIYAIAVINWRSDGRQMLHTA